jgi:hypothetical protein
MRIARLLALAGLLAALTACGEGGPGEKTYPGIPGALVPPDFTLVDQNLDSPTHGDALTLSEMYGTVVVVYYLNYG